MYQKVGVIERPLTIVVDEQHQLKYAGWGSPPKDTLARRDIVLTGALAGVRNAEGLAALLTLMWWGAKIRPWLGTVKLGERGQVVLDDPDYEREIEISLPKNLPRVAKVVIV